ncbi:hypothetical protein IGI04_008758 [Brassica rapa subsp. trilocularis]|uniref:Uncharacterized protein n=1 Tax=Brassica rapa subsp. trilocularis TaxID=1813537 RepID=A0ABQ7MVC8_BRACM|nr:hypothetical protein IGI04_008758 [Brassica rapa subsp. trilocularis]
MKSKTKDREKSRLADGICCWTYVSLNKMPGSVGKIDMDPALAGRMSLSRFGQGMEWIDGRHKEQWISSLICHTAALNGFAQLKDLGFLC